MELLWVKISILRCFFSQFRCRLRSRQGLREVDFENCGTMSCESSWKIVYITYGILGISVMPLALWCCYKHINVHRTKSSRNKLLYGLSIAVYLCTIIGSIFTTIGSFAGCYISTSVWYQLWYAQCIFWVLQLFFFIWLLFSRYAYNSYFCQHYSYVQRSLQS